MSNYRGRKRNTAFRPASDSCRRTMIPAKPRSPFQILRTPPAGSHLFETAAHFPAILEAGGWMPLGLGRASNAQAREQEDAGRGRVRGILGHRCCSSEVTAPPANKEIGPAITSTPTSGP